MGCQEDDDWFNSKYAEASCWDHGTDNMYYDEDTAEWVCLDCEDDEDE